MPLGITNFATPSEVANANPDEASAAFTLIVKSGVVVQLDKLIAGTTGAARAELTNNQISTHHGRSAWSCTHRNERRDCQTPATRDSSEVAAGIIDHKQAPGAIRISPCRSGERGSQCIRPARLRSQIWTSRRRNRKSILHSQVVAGLKEPVVNAALSGIAVAAASSSVIVTLVTAFRPPVSDMMIIFRPLGDTSRRSISSGKV